MPDLLTDLTTANPVTSVLLSACTTMRIGGPARLVSVNERTALAQLVAGPHRWLGRGANLLVGDDGVDEPVLRLGPAFAEIVIAERRDELTTVRVGAAADLAQVIATCIGAGLAGPEGLAGVPATVGGALKMNAGTSTCWMLDWVSRVEVLLPGEDEPRWVERAALPASYRSSGLPAGTVFLGAELALAAGDPAVLRAQATKLKQAKATSQPLAMASAGCVFKNPAPTLPAGKLIDDLGLKGTRVGGATISPIHANFIVNDRTATCADVCTLIRQIRARALHERGVSLQLEVETWNCPL